MDLILIPFICLGSGIVMGIFVKWNRFAGISEKVSTIALVFLMLTIGIQIGLDQTIIDGFLEIGLKCCVITILAISCSVICTVICEKTVLPLKDMDLELKQKKLDVFSVENNEIMLDPKLDDEKQKTKGSKLVWIMPSSIILGLLTGIIIRGEIKPTIVENSFTIFLIILYVCVGISQGANKEVFHYIRLLGLKVIWISIAILVGSILGGIIAGIILGLPLHIPVLSASGMSFYSFTGAYMTEAYGLEAGTYGFIVNVLREFFTILFMPLLIKISQGSPIAGGAAGNMDTMLAPITKFVGVRLGLVTLVTGTILTSTVLFLLPLLASFF